MVFFVTLLVYFLAAYYQVGASHALLLSQLQNFYFSTRKHFQVQGGVAHHTVKMRHLPKEVLPSLSVAPEAQHRQQTLPSPATSCYSLTVRRFWDPKESSTCFSIWKTSILDKSLLST